MTEFFSPPDDLGEPRASELHTNLGERIGASAGEAVFGGTRSLWRLGEYAEAEGKFDHIEPDEFGLGFRVAPDKPAPHVAEIPITEAIARVRNEGLEKHVKLPDVESIRSPVLDLMVAHAHERRQQEAAIGRGPQGFFPGALDFITSIGVGIIDPVNIAAFSIPVVGEARLGMMLGAAGESMLARAGVKAGIGAAQGALGSTALTPMDWWLHTKDGQDYTMAEALHSIILGAGMGGLFHAGLGAVGDIRARRRGLPLPGSPEDQALHALLSEREAAEPTADLQPGDIAERIHGIANAGETTVTVNGKSVTVGEPVHPAEVLADLPPQVQEDVVRASVADVVNGNAVRAGEMLGEAGKEDPRIAESLGDRLRERLGLISPEEQRAPAAAISPAQVPVDNSHTVESGAVASKDPNGPVYVDEHIPEFSPKLKTANGQPARLWTYLAEHEVKERKAMADGMSYEDAHNKVATPAERALVEADGVDWNEYTEEIDGYLDRVEVEKETNPPPDPHINPDEAILGDKPHHHSHNKEATPTPEQRAEAEAKVGGEATGETDGVVHIRPRAARGPRARDPETWSLLEYLASRGGIDPNEKLIGDLRGVVGGNKFVPGFGHLIRKGGMSLDRAREAAVEGKYLFEPGDHSAGLRETTITTLLDAIEREARGERVYRMGVEPPRDAVREKDERQRWLDKQEARFDDALKAVEIKPENVSDALRKRVLEIMEREGEDDPLIAWERAVMEETQHGAETGAHQRIAEEIPGWDVPDDAGAAPSTGGAFAGGGQRGTGAAARAPGAGDRAQAGQRADWRKLADARRPDDTDVIEASHEADKAPEPQSTNPEKALSEAEKAATEADKLLADILPRLSDEERVLFEDALNKLGQDKTENEQIVREGTACLLAAAG